MDIPASQALAWRLGRHFLRDSATSVTEVVRRLCGVPARSGDPDLAIGRRLDRPAAADVRAAQESGELLRTYAFRGATQLFATDDAGVYLAVRGGSRQWLLSSWRTHYGLDEQDWESVRAVVRDTLAAGPISQADLADAVVAQRRFRHLREGLTSRSQTLWKPFAWQGDLCFGPVVEGRTTFQSPQASPHWVGLPEVDDAGRRAVLGYLAAYGPAPRENLHYWLVGGLSAGRRRLERWLADLSDRQVGEVCVDGRPMLHLREDLDSLATAAADPEEVTLLPGYDQWVLGPGTADESIVPAEHRQAVSLGANVVLQGGRVVGTWAVRGDAPKVSAFAGSAALPGERLRQEFERLARLLGATT